MGCIFNSISMFLKDQKGRDIGKSNALEHSPPLIRFELVLRTSVAIYK